MNWEITWEKRGNSFNEAMKDMPFARKKERDLLIEAMEINRNQVLVEVAPCGDAFFSKGVHSKFGPGLKYLAIEPSPIHANSLPPFMTCIENGDFSNFQIHENSVDRIANLAGLHHCDLIEKFFEEAYRILKTGGILGVADVCAKSSVAYWLNNFVDYHSQVGHDGNFFLPNDLSSLMRASGFCNVIERRESFTWDFPSKESMAFFCKKLFFLNNASNELIIRKIKEILGYVEKPDLSVSLNWELLYCTGKKIN